MLIEKIKPNFVFEDERGCITQLIREGYKQVNFITSKKGVKRGGHYHKSNEELFYIISGKMTLIAKKGNKEEVYRFEKGDMFNVLPNVFHSFEFEADTLLISMYSLGVELPDGTKDIFVK